MPRKLILALSLLAVAVGAHAFEPLNGNWWNPAESGRDFNIDIQANTLVLTFYSYNPDGSVQWYLAAGPMTNDRHDFSATLQKYQGGQCLTCVYSGPPDLTGNDGTISLHFADQMHATASLPGGRTTQLTPINFGYGDPPQGLLGEWVFDENVNGSWFVSHYNLTETVAGTAGTATAGGMAFDRVNRAGCAYQDSGQLAGYVVCVSLDSSGNTTDEYVFYWGFEKTFNGFWTTPNASTTYPMAGFKISSSAGDNYKSSPLRANRHKDVFVKQAPTDAVTASVQAVASDIASEIRKMSPPR